MIISVGATLVVALVYYAKNKNIKLPTKLSLKDQNWDQERPASYLLWT